MHFVYGFCDGNARAAVDKYQRRFPEVVRTINTRENILEMVQRSPRLSTRRMVSRLGVSRMQVWRTLHEEVHVKCLEP